MVSRSLLAILLVVSSFSLSAQTADPSGHWEGVIHAPEMDVVVAFDLARNDKGEMSGTFSNAAENLHGMPLASVAADGLAVTFALPGGAVCQKGSNVTLDVKSVGGAFAGTLNGSEINGTWTQGKITAPVKFLRNESNTPVDRWAAAAGGREKLAGIKTMYREATIEIGGMKGTIKAWHTSDGHYRKEEQVGAFSTIETFDGTNGTLRQGDGAPHAMAGAELERARSTAYANWNAIFFALFPERRRGTLTIEDDETVVMKPEGGIDWRVTLDPSTSLPKVMTHQQNDRTITVMFVAYEPIDGIQFEKEIHRSTGDPRFDAVIRFTKTWINPPLEASFFSTGSTQ